MPTLPKIDLTKWFTTWSHSRLTDHEKCGFYAYLKHLAKLPDPGGASMVRGSAVHEEAQRYSIQERAARMPRSLQNFTEEFRWLRKHRRILEVEQQLALDRKWQPTAWFESDAVKQGKPMPWVRLVMDAVVPEPEVITIIDYKTGKVYDSNKPQLELYAIGGFAKFPDRDRVEAKLWYLDQGVEHPQTFERKQLPVLQKRWALRVASMLADRTFKPKPNRFCTWCPYRKSAGGPCTY